MRSLIGWALGLLLWSLAATVPAGAQTVFEAESELRGFQPEVWELRGLPPGTPVDVRVLGLTGNLDPAVAVFPADVDILRFARETLPAVAERARAAGDDVAARQLEALDEVTLAFNDDAANGYDPEASFAAPAEPLVRIVVASARTLTNPSQERDTIGHYALLVAVPDEAATGATLVPDPDWPRSSAGVATHEIVMEPGDRVLDLDLVDVGEGAEVAASITWPAGADPPRLTLRDLGGKTLDVATPTDEPNTAAFRWRAPSPKTDLRLRIGTAGEQGSRVRVRAAIDMPLSAPLDRGRDPIMERPEVAVGMRIDQITSVDQISENFGVVGTLKLTWRDPHYAFRSDRCGCAAMVLDEPGFKAFLAERGAEAPGFVFVNQQGRRATHDLLYRIEPSGRTTYTERFDGTFQAPDFDFRRFPFDDQTFRIRVALYESPQHYRLAIAEGGPTLGPQLGEEQWRITSIAAAVVDQDGMEQVVTTMHGERHLTYYFVRIIIPMTVVLFMSWFVFFLRDLGKRIDVAAGNLLLLIAINFTVAGDLPRLGYATFLDVALLLTFLGVAALVLINTWLKHMVEHGDEERAQPWDRALRLGYPLFFLVPLALSAVIMLR